MSDTPSKKSDANADASRLYSIANCLCFAFGVACLMLGVARLWQSNIPDASLGLGAGLLLIFAATVDRFELLKGLGIEAKTRALRETIDDADKAAERLRPIAQLALRGLMQLNAQTGRWGMPLAPADVYRQARDVKRILEELGSNEADVQVTMEPWARYACVDVAFAILRPYEKGLGEIQQQRQRVVDAFPQPIRNDDPAFVDAVAAVREVGPYKANLLEQVSKWRIDEFPERLREIVANASPLAKPTPFDALQTQVEKWAPEMEHLARKLDFRVPEMWFAEIRKAHGE